jgi:hypothetical protein
MEDQIKTGASEKAPYQPPTLYKREPLNEVVEGVLVGSVVAQD